MAIKDDTKYVCASGHTALATTCEKNRVCVHCIHNSASLSLLSPETLTPMPCARLRVWCDVTAAAKRVRVKRNETRATRLGAVYTTRRYCTRCGGVPVRYDYGRDKSAGRKRPIVLV